MVCPKNGFDDLGQEAISKTTFLRYNIEIGFDSSKKLNNSGLYIQYEALSLLPKTETKEILRKIGATDI